MINRSENITNNSRIVGENVDLGAYERSSLTPQPIIPDFVPNANIIYVKQDAVGNNNGTSWDNAYTSLQDAINASKAGTQIWVSTGIYKPGTTNRNQSFKLKNLVEIYGGFIGNETDISQRDWENNETILSGNIGSISKKNDNSYHVVETKNNTSSSILDGFVIADGYADDSYDNHQGGGIYSDRSNAILRNLVIKNNYALEGGGMYSNESLHLLENITFLENTADDYGGGIKNDSSNSIFSNVGFIGNKSKDDGGAIYNYSSNIGIIKSSFTDNSGDDGGAIYNGYWSNTNIVNSTFNSNIARDFGGAIYNYNNLQIINSILENNSADLGGALYNNYAYSSIKNTNFIKNKSNIGTAIYDEGSDSDLLEVVNSIFWQNVDRQLNTSDPIYSDRDNLAVNYSIIEGDYQGEGNMNVNPLFVNENNSDFRLKINSPAIDKGDMSVNIERKDISSKDRIINKDIDLGAFEYIPNPPVMEKPIYRLQNKDIPGTYLFVGEEERQNIKQNYPNYQEEGLAFKVGVDYGDELIPLYRFQNKNTPGTYLFVGEEERQNIKQNYPDTFIEEGLAFYVYGSESNNGTSVYRFNNLDRSGTYLFVGEEERQYIKQNHPNFIEEGMAFNILF